jgi:hypothetical protein
MSCFWRSVVVLLLLQLSDLYCFTQQYEHTKDVQVCEEDAYFETILTTWHYEPETALESYTFRSKLNGNRDKRDLDRDITATCEDYAVVNCDAVAGIIHAQYDAFIAKLIADEDKGIHLRNQSCITIRTVDGGYREHRRSGKSLTVQPAVTTEGMLFPMPASPQTAASEVTTVVSGYWRAKNKYTQDAKGFPHEEWMKNSLSLHMPYVLFTDPDRVELIKQCRGSLPTLIALRNITDFVTYDNYDPSWLHELHVPTRELAMIWLEKINLLFLASQLTNSTFYAWVDAGLGPFRSTPMPKEEWSLDVLQSLPPKRLSYAQAHSTYHSFAAGVTVMRRDVIPIIHKLFYGEYDRCRREVHDWRCGSDQFLLSNLRDRHPHLFHAMSYDYGDISHLWANRYSFSKSKK